MVLHSQLYMHNTCKQPYEDKCNVDNLQKPMYSEVHFAVSFYVSVPFPVINTYLLEIPQRKKHPQPQVL